MIRHKLLMDAQQTVATGLLGEGIKVVYDAKTPYADLKNRVMHLRPLPEHVDDEALLHLRADCDHELGHFGATDPDALEGIDRPLVQVIANTIEDGYIERWVSNRWLGCAENLHASNKAILAEIKSKALDTQSNRRARAVTALQTIAFGKTPEVAIALLGEDIRPLLNEVSDLLDKLPTVNNTGQSVALARQFADRWRWGEKNKRDEQKPEDDEQTDSADADGEQPQPKPMTPEENRREAKVAREIDGKGIADQRKRMVKLTEFSPRDTYYPYTDEDDISRLRVPEEIEPHPFMQSVRAVVPTLRRRLLMEFRGVAPQPVPAQERGILDRTALHRVALGARNVFEEEHDLPIVDADVTLLVDLSASMLTPTKTAPSRLYVAAQAACAFSMSLDLMGVPHECLGFTTRNRLGRAHKKLNKPYQRVRPLRHLIVKSASERFHAAKRRFAALSRYGHGGASENIDGESVMWAARRLAARNRAGMKPVLIVFSDGEPMSNPEHTPTLARHLKKTVKRVESAGIDVIGVGIDTPFVEQYYSRHVYVQKIDDLVKVTYGLLSQVGNAYRRHA